MLLVIGRTMSYFGRHISAYPSQTQSAKSSQQSVIVSSYLSIEQLENVAIANALQLEAARRREVPLHFNFVARVKFDIKSLSLFVAILERFYCLYVTLRCDLDL